jgi:peptidyl-tRNA hydrolase
LADHVLGTFTADEEAAMDQVVPAAAKACRVWVEEGLEACRDRFNGPVEQA